MDRSPESEGRSEIAFFDVETTVPTRTGQRFAILEFGAILVCPKKLVELRSYSTLVKPSDLSLISSLSVRCNGISRNDVLSAPSFADIADTVYDILDGRIWAGHNILRFDCARIREAFAEIGRPAPEPKGTIDSLALLTQKFGRRAGNMKMATLATYFGLGQQTHRSLDDVRMNLEVLKYCATVLFLESSLPDVLLESSASPKTSARQCNYTRVSPENAGPSANTSSSGTKQSPSVSPSDQSAGENHPIISLLTRSNEPESSNSLASPAAQRDSFDMSVLRNEMTPDAVLVDTTMEEEADTLSKETFSSVAVASEGCSGHAGFLEPDEVSIRDITATLVPFYHGSQRIKLFYRSAPLQLHCFSLKVRFGISGKFVDHAGRPRLNFVVDLYPSFCKVLEACDDVAQKLSIESGSGSDWRPVVMTRKGFVNYPTARIHLPTELNGDASQLATEIYQRDSSGTTQKLIFSKLNITELEPLFNPGTLLDAFFLPEPYDYQQNAGIRLVAKKLVIHS